jgi:hypothetical protein
MFLKRTLRVTMSLFIFCYSLHIVHQVNIVMEKFISELAVPGMRCNAIRKPPSRSTSHEVC